MAVRLGGMYPPKAGLDYLTFLKQYGVDDVAISIGVFSVYPAWDGSTTGGRWNFLEVVQVRQRCEDIGLRVGAVEGGGQIPPMLMDKIWLGLPGRDEQIENLALNIETLGRAGIPVLGYHWMANPPGAPNASWRQSNTTRGRGGALVTACDMAVLERAPLSRDREYTEAEMWANYEYFIKAILPVCEGAGVKLALHPDDPPVARLGGIPRLFHDVAGFQRAMEIANNSPYSGLNFCLGNWTAMGIDTIAATRHFGSRGQIIYGHAQGVRGTVPKFTECFLDEADCDFLAVIEALNDVGCDCFITPQHEPHTVNDSDLRYHGTAFGLGYLRALIKAAERSR